MTFKTQSLVLAAGLVIAGTWVTPRASAQGPGGPPPPEVQATMKRWAAWQASHKNLSDLQRMTRRVRGLDRNPATRLTKPQASKLLAIMTKWQSKPVMSESQAKGVVQQINGLLSANQRKMLAQAPGRFRGGPGGPGRFGGMRPGGPGGPGRMRPGGPVGPAGMRPGGMRPGGPGGMRPMNRMGGPGGPGGPGGRRGGGFRMGNPPTGGFNPLNPSTLPFAPMRDRAKQSQAEFMTELAQRAKGR